MRSSNLSIWRPWWSSPRGRLATFGTLALLVAALAIPTVFLARMMTPAAGRAAVSPSQLQSMTVGSSVTVALRLDTASRRGFKATVLSQQGSSSYKATSRRIAVVVDKDTRVQMGSTSDLKPGAVVQVEGVLNATDTITARSATVLTGYVEVAG